MQAKHKTCSTESTQRQRTCGGMALLCDGNNGHRSMLHQAFHHLCGTSTANGMRRWMHFLPRPTPGSPVLSRLGDAAEAVGRTVLGCLCEVRRLPHASSPPCQSFRWAAGWGHEHFLPSRPLLEASCPALPLHAIQSTHLIMLAPCCHGRFAMILV